MKRIACAALLFCLSVSNYTLAQVNAIVTGTVSDATGALIPGVEVTARNVNTGITTTRVTNETGSYDFPSLQPGSYTVSAALSGFQTASYNNVQLGQGQQVRLNFTLQVGAAAQSVEVVVAADTLLATTSASVGNVLPETAVAVLPLSSRNVLDLVSTTPGVVTTINAFGAPVQNFGGTPFSQVNTTRDGLVTNDGRYNNSNGAYSAVYTSPDMVEEVRVTTNNVDPALGRGSAQVQMRTRAGSNEFHGALFYTNNNSKFITQPWFQNLAGAPKSYQNRNQFGGRLGGPIIKNKAFFFVLIDDQRFLEKMDTVATVLTPAARQGIFQYLTEGATGANGGATRRNGNAFSTTPSVNLAGQVLTANPLNGAPLFLNSFNLFTDVRDPNRTRIDPVWFGPQYLTRMPLPNDWTVGDGLSTAGFRWKQPHEGLDGATGQSQNANRNHLTTRIDYQLNTANRLTYTMSREKDWGVTGQTGLPDYNTGAFGDVKRVPDFYTASWTSTLSSTVLNEFRFGFKRDTWQGTSPLDKGCCWNGKGEDDLVDSAKQMRASFPSIGGKFVYVRERNLAFVNTAATPNVTYGMAYAPFGVASPRQSISPFQQWSDTLSFTMGAHSFQTGAELNFASSHQFNHGGQQTTRPFVNLGVGTIPVPNITTTNFRGIQANDITMAQNVLAHLAGTIGSIEEQYFVNSPTATDWSDYRTTVLFQRDLHENDWDFFFKDNWRVSKNLTLNLGLRYDKYGVPYDTTGLGGRFTGGQSALFGCSGKDFSVWWSPGAGDCGGASPTLTTTEFVGKHSQNPDKLFWGNDWNNFAPSFGFSYQIPWFTRSTVVRGGYGINYAGAADYLSYSGNIGNLPGQTLNVTFTPSTYLDLSGLPGAGVVPVPTGGAKPFSAVPLTNRVPNISGYADKRVTPYVQSFNFSVQRELARNLTLDASWIGNKATKLFSSTQLNEMNIFENGILEAFNITRGGGNAPLFDRLLNGLNVTGVGVVNGTTIRGSQALRALATTNQFIANGSVGSLANFINSTSSFTGVNGGLLRNARLPENFVVVSPQFGQVTLEGNNSSSTYHSFQSVLTKRLSQGVYGQFSYTFSKALGDNAGINDTRNPRSRQLSKGLLSIDRTHIVKANGIFDLPFGPGHMLLANASGPVQRIVEGWEFSSVFSWISGAPRSFRVDGITATSINTFGYRAQNTADLVGTLPKDLGKVEKGNGFVQYFSNLSTRSAPSPNFGGDTNLPGRFTNQVIVDQSGNIVLQNPQPGATGNTALNLPGLQGPAQLGLDIALSKKLRIAENKTFTLRADAINALNRPIWDNPNTDINSTSFGRITSARGNRTITFNARIDF
ncbi:MAG TPA: TonB-dependent receptor [Terriglobia bacterium]|nr:TonB-dependent receptor [Terriglobia bacterium]